MVAAAIWYIPSVLGDNRQLLTGTYLTIIGRTVGMAVLVTVTDAILALPFASYMARIASRRGRQLLFTAVLLPSDSPSKAPICIFARPKSPH